MNGWRWRVVWLGLCLSAAACESSPPSSPSESPPPSSCETTASCGDRREGTPDSGTPPPSDAGTPPPSSDAGTPPPSDAGTPEQPPTPSGETLWQQHQTLGQQEYAASVAATSDGQAIYTATAQGSGSARGSAQGSSARFVLRRSSGSGQVQWTREYHLIAFEGVPAEDPSGIIRLSVGPAGDLYVLTEVHDSWVDFGAGPATGLVLTKLSASAQIQWSVQLPATDHLLAVTASREDGAFVSVLTASPYSEELRCAPLEGAIYRFNAWGAQLWRTPLGEPQCEGQRTQATTLAAQPEGGVALGGSFFGELRVGAQRFTAPIESPFFGTLNGLGEWSWVEAFPNTQGRVTSLGSSAKGTVVVAGTLNRGALRWGPDSLGEVPSFLLVAESTGEPRWAKSLGRSERPVIAVEPAGRVVVAGLSRDYPKAAPGSQDPAQNPQLFVRRFNLAGKTLWNRFFARSGGPANLFTEEFTSAAPSGEGNGNTLLFGHFSHTEDFGKGPILPSGTDTILLKVGPGPEF